MMILIYVIIDIWTNKVTIWETNFIKSLNLLKIS